jgi:uncharacterized protein YigA (DUF484 family)
MSKVVDFQAEAIGRLRSRVEAMEAAHAELLAHTRDHAGAEAMVQQAVLLALEAGSLDHLIHTITADWVDVLGLDAIVLALGGGRQGLRVSGTGLQFIDQRALRGLVPSGQRIALRVVDEGAGVFGPAAPLIRSEALIALTLASPLPAGVLALGSREAHPFDAVRGLPQLSFLGGVVERLLGHWLTRTP